MRDKTVCNLWFNFLFCLDRCRVIFVSWWGRGFVRFDRWGHNYILVPYRQCLSNTGVRVNPNDFFSYPLEPILSAMSAMYNTLDPVVPKSLQCALAHYLPHTDPTCPETPEGKIQPTEWRTR